MVISDGIQQKEPPPGMPHSTGCLTAYGTVQRTKRTYIASPLTPELANSLGLFYYIFIAGFCYC